jgi:signal transduction histidine kinase
VIPTLKNKDFKVFKYGEPEEDDGCGIPMGLIERAKEPFFTSKSNGTGLGLPICQSIADLHEAKLLIESCEGFGTTVTLQFPIPYV